MGNQNNSSKNLIFENNFLKVHFFITMAYKDFEFCLHSLHINSKGLLVQIFNLCLDINCVSKNGKHFLKFVKHYFLSHAKHRIGPE